MSGQFVAVWTQNNRIWSDTYEWREGKVFRYVQYEPENNTGDDFSDPVTLGEVEHGDQDPIYFTR